MTLYIAPIVEGQTEQGCVAALLYRIWSELLQAAERLQVLTAFRGKRDSLIHLDGQKLSETVQKAFLKLQSKVGQDKQGRGLVLILLDAEDDPACQLAPRLLKAARNARSDACITCVLAQRMFENWIIAGSSSLGGVNGLPSSVQVPSDPESRNGPLWLEQQLRSQDRTRQYKKTVDAAEFVRKMNLGECRCSTPSFDKLCRELAQAALPAPPEPADPG